MLFSMDVLCVLLAQTFLVQVLSLSPPHISRLALFVHRAAETTICITLLYAVIRTIIINAAVDIIVIIGVIIPMTIIGVIVANCVPCYFRWFPLVVHIPMYDYFDLCDDGHH